MKSSTASVSTPTESLLMLRPEQVLVTEDNNIRFNLTKLSVEEMCDLIIKDGQINTPLEVQELTEDQQKEFGFKYRLTVGHRRYAGAVMANEKFKAGILLPCRVYNPADAKERLLRQISENHNRQSLSPLDEAKAMQTMIDEGFSRQDIRNTFSVTGGKKGLKVGPCSNSHVNQTLAFLTYPKVMQNLIHSGQITASAAYDFAKYDPAKWPDMCKALEAKRVKQLEAEEAADEKLDAAGKKKAEAEAKIEGVKTALETAEAAAKAAAEAKATLDEEEIAVLKKVKSAPKSLEPAKKKELETALQTAQKNSKLAAAEAEKTEKALEVVRKKAAAIEEKLSAAKTKVAADKAGNGSKLNQKDVKEAAKTAVAERVKGAADKLSPKEMRDTLNSISRPSGYPKVDAITKAFYQTIEGVLNQNQLITVLAKLTGEYKPATKK